MSPDEEPGTATAEPEVPETPQLGEQPPPTEEAVPAAEQEQPEGDKPKGDSETQEQADEAPDAAEVYRQLLRDNPNLLEIAKEEAGVADDGTLDERERDFAQREIEQAAIDRQAALTKTVEAVAAYTPQGIQQATTTWSNELARRVSADATELMKAGEGDANLIDGAAIAQQISGYVGQVALGWSNYQNELFNGVFTAIEKGVAHGHLTADEKKTLRDARSKSPVERLIEAWPIYEAAALRSAPEVKGKAEAKKTAADQKLTDSLNDLVGKIGNRNGRTRAEPAGGSAGPTTLADIDDALRTGPTADIDGLLRRRATLTE